MSYKRMLQEEERLKEEIEEMLEEAEATDRAEDERFGRENRGDELPQELGRRRDRLNLSKVASKRVGSATLESKTKQVRRFFSNEQVDPKCCYEPVAELLLKQAASRRLSGPIRVLVDTLELSGERQVLMAALAHRRRALPVCWQVRRRTGVSGVKKQKSLLEALSERIPSNCASGDPEVIVVGDGAFHSTDLMSYLSSIPLQKAPPKGLSRQLSGSNCTPTPTSSSRTGNGSNSAISRPKRGAKTAISTVST